MSLASPGARSSVQLITPRLSATCFSVGGVVVGSISTVIAVFSEIGSRSIT